MANPETLKKAMEFGNSLTKNNQVLKKKSQNNNEKFPAAHYILTIAEPICSLHYHAHNSPNME